MTVGLGNLEIELLSLILEFVVDSSPSTTETITLVNKHWYSTSKLVAHRSKTIEYDTIQGEAGKRTDLKAWLQNDELLRGVRRITVNRRRSSPFGSRPESEEQDREALEKAKYDDLISLISRLGNLKTLIWSHSDPIPAKVLEALHEHHKKALTHLAAACGRVKSARVCVASCPTCPLRLH